MPAGTARSSPVSARVGPYRFTSRSASIAGVSLINAPVTVRSQGILRIVVSTLLIASGHGGWFWFCARVNRYRYLDPGRPRRNPGHTSPLGDRADTAKPAQQGEPRGSPRSNEVNPGVHSLRIASLRSPVHRKLTSATPVPRLRTP